MNLNVKGKSKGAILSLTAAVLDLAVLIGWSIYAGVNAYFNPGTLICLILAIACSALYFASEKPQLDFLPLAAVLSGSIAFAFFGYISLPVWQDGISGFHMYGSRGSLESVIVLTAAFLIEIVVGIVCCFLRKKEA